MASALVAKFGEELSMNEEYSVGFRFSIALISIIVISIIIGATIYSIKSLADV